tara:strand:- start:1129 stop:1362 length:234 start_codon:yes stop_codon:yes gene_type:complete
MPVVTIRVLFDHTIGGVHRGNVCILFNEAYKFRDLRLCVISWPYALGELEKLLFTEGIMQDNDHSQAGVFLGSKKGN